MTEEYLTEETAEEASVVEDCEAEETDVCDEEDCEEECIPAAPSRQIVINIFASDTAEALRALKEAGVF